MDYTEEEEEKELACIICTTNSCSRNSKFAFVPNDHLALCSDSLCIACRVLAAGYRKIDPEIITALEKADEIICSLCYVVNPQHATADHGLGCKSCAGREERLRIIAHSKRQLQDMEG